MIPEWCHVYWQWDGETLQHTRMHAHHIHLLCMIDTKRWPHTHLISILWISVCGGLVYSAPVHNVDTSAAQRSQYGGGVSIICEEKLNIPTKWLPQEEIQRIEIGWAWGPRRGSSVVIGIEIVSNFEDHFVMSNYKMVGLTKLIFFAVLSKEYYHFMEWKTRHIFSNHGVGSMNYTL
jgi:hypothetical protein